MDASWPTTSPRTRVATAPEKVPTDEALPLGMRLDEFEIVRVLGCGGFGIVYLAYDHVLQRDVAIKEYMPAALAGRGSGTAVVVRAAGHAETFAKGLESFLCEARLLASFDHRSLVKVHRFWEGNGTAYMAMQYYPGQTLKDTRLRMVAAPDDAWLHGLVDSLLGALEVLHGSGVYHRDISPDNILIVADGQPVLLDFGSARRVVSDSTQSLTTLLKPHFAPIEQYADEAALPQGPWTDLYSLGATLHFVITGRAPTPSVLRAVRDVLPTLSASAADEFAQIAPTLLATVDWSLALAPDERPQSVVAFRRALAGAIAVPRLSQRHTVAGRAHPWQDEDDDEGTAATAPATAPVAALPTAAAFAGSEWADDASVPSGDVRRGMRVGATGLLAMLGMAALAWGAWTLNRQSAPVVRGVGVAAETRAPMASVAPADPIPAASAAGPEPLALRVSAEPASSPSPVPSAVAAARALPSRQSASPAPVSFASHRSAGRARSVRPKPAAASVKVARDDSTGKCAARGLFASALCMLGECKSARARATPRCAQRLYAEEARQRRMERE